MNVLIDGKKVCGILSQIKTAASEVDFIVLGIGINVNISYSQFSKGNNAFSDLFGHRNRQGKYPVRID